MCARIKPKRIERTHRRRAARAPPPLGESRGIVRGEVEMALEREARAAAHRLEQRRERWAAAAFWRRDMSVYRARASKTAHLPGKMTELMKSVPRRYSA